MRCTTGLAPTLTLERRDVGVVLVVENLGDDPVDLLGLRWLYLPSLPGLEAPDRWETGDLRGGPRDDAIEVTSGRRWPAVVRFLAGGRMLAPGARAELQLDVDDASETAVETRMVVYLVKPGMHRVAISGPLMLPAGR